MGNGNRSSYFSGLFSFSCREHFVAFVNDRGKALKVEVRDLCSDEEWRGSFSPNYIEELTKKTGNFKRFDVFLTMLNSLLCQRNKSLSIDFVSYGDLDKFQKKRLERRSLTFSVGKERPINHRYLVLTYISDFDRTFYPLPLTYFGVVDKEALFRRIHKLRDAFFNKGNYRELVGNGDPPFDDECRNRIAVLESERDNALTELSRLRSVLHILHGKDYRVLGNVPSQRTCSSHITNRPAISSKMMSFPSKGCSMNRRSLSMSTSSHNSGDRLHQNVVKLEETSRLSRQSPSPIFPNRLRFPAANCAVISGRESTASTLQQRRLPLWKPNLNKSSTAVASRRWDRLISGESNSSGLSDCNLQRACRLSEKRYNFSKVSNAVNR